MVESYVGPTLLTILILQTKVKDVLVVKVGISLGEGRVTHPKKVSQTQRKTPF